MWAIEKPSVQAAMSDVEKFRKLGIIDDKDSQALEHLVEQYDQQDGVVSEVQNNTVSSKGRDALLEHYTDTEKGKELNYIRQELNEGVYMMCTPKFGLINNSDSMSSVLYRAHVV